MLRYAFNRLLLIIPTLIGVAVLVFFMLRSCAAMAAPSRKRP